MLNKKRNCYYCERPLTNMPKLAPGEISGLSCAEVMLLPTIEHIVPKVRGGNNQPANKMWCCKSCNALKGHMLPGEFAEYMRRTRHVCRDQIIANALKLQQYVNDNLELIKRKCEH